MLSSTEEHVRFFGTLRQKTSGSSAGEKEHAIHIRGYHGTNEELGRDIARMRYDAFLCVLRGAALEVYAQMQNDAARGRKTLARRLYAVYIGLAGTRHAVQLVWVLCRPHMGKEFKRKPEIKAGQIQGY